MKNGKGAGTTELHLARLYGKTLNQNYVLFYLKTPNFLKLGESKMTGTVGQKSLPKDFFAKNPFPLPPLAEQRRIFSKVDELFSLCDALKERIAASQGIRVKLADAVVEAGCGIPTIQKQSPTAITRLKTAKPYRINEQFSIAAEPE